MNTDVGQNRWIEAGLAEIAARGVEGVRVEALAKTLGVTKGGFYWHFADRRALLAAMLESWSRGRIVAFEAQAQRAGTTAQEQLHGLVSLYTGSPNPQGLAIELAIRQWARHDDEAAAAVAQVDAARLRIVGLLYQQLGLEPSSAAARAFMLYSFVFGQSLVFSGEPKREQATSIAACVEFLTRTFSAAGTRR
jgi:AcrR family transcriptional regulator